MGHASVLTAYEQKADCLALILGVTTTLFTFTRRKTEQTDVSTVKGVCRTAFCNGDLDRLKEIKSATDLEIP